MKNTIGLFLLLFSFLFMTACNVQDIEKYNDDFIGEWRTDIYFSPTKGDSIRNYLTVDGHDSGLGLACETDDPFEKCLYFQAGKVKYNKASKGIQIGNSVQQVHYVDQEPYVNGNGKWELIIDSISYYKY